MSDSGNALGNANGMYFILLRFRKRKEHLLSSLKAKTKF